MTRLKPIVTGLCNGLVDGHHPVSLYKRDEETPIYRLGMSHRGSPADSHGIRLDFPELLSVFSPVESSTGN